VQPYKNEGIAEEAVAAIRETYEAYREQKNLTGMDLAHK
jgi:hypothetical protein